MWKFRWMSLVALMALFAFAAFGQSDYGSLSGFAKDPSGASIPKAKISIRNEGTGEEHVVTTNESGYYTLTNLTPGFYTVPGWCGVRDPSGVTLRHRKMKSGEGEQGSIAKRWLRRTRTSCQRQLASHLRRDCMHRFLSRTHVVSAALGLLLVLSSSAALAQYQATYLTSDLTGKAKHTDPLLKNAWGLAYSPGAPFWISDEASGYSTLYDGMGNPQSLQVKIPPATGTAPGAPTGIVYNGSTEFKIDTWTSVFLFATLDGTISGWSAFDPSTALIGVKTAGAVYTGLAITSKTSGNSLFAADSANNKVDIFDGNFNLTGSFTDPAIPAGFAPFGIQDIGGQVYVSFASTSGASGGYIDIFTETGTLVKHFTHGKPLNQPWGFAVAPTNFGTFSKALLISNNTSTGSINAYNLTTGKLMGTLSNSAGKALSISGLWGIEFGGGSSSNGQKNQLFFTAGPNDTDGYFGVIVFK